MDKYEVILKQINELFKEFLVDDIRSTNVKKMKWDSVSKDLVVQFMDNSVYTYFNVPEAIFNRIQDGMAGTKTAGEHGPKGKYPSVGAAIWTYLIEGGFRYKRGGTI